MAWKRALCRSNGQRRESRKSRKGLRQYFYAAVLVFVGINSVQYVFAFPRMLEVNYAVPYSFNARVLSEHRTVKITNLDIELLDVLRHPFSARNLLYPARIIQVRAD